ncbi:hypothetical protein [Rhodopirellula sp. MGV]|uniref:hypothetical protein n=1 Tax=Rhodopirellula sp. MGV TaxID=2023130 RepID=UPI000B97962D|nr:hypothetical protein [Rhodopirellula sp. MGV]OYP31006.1 hypothetical protein CGZ80_21765 [Rhodopirellula sp. MGV]PNY34647.1 hypothetical protein C2E31_21945 [Rhodopirellula baltica]
MLLLWRSVSLAMVLSIGVTISNSAHANYWPNFSYSPSMLSGAAVARAVLRYFGKEGAEEATEFLARSGGRELAERVATTALREGGEETTEQVALFVSKHGPDALKALDNAPEIRPLLSALDELPEAQVKTALARLSAGASGRELAEAVAKNGSKVLQSELRHPGVGGFLARSLGDDGAKLAGELSTDQAIAVARHADDLAALPATQRAGVMRLLHQDAEKMVGFLGRFAAANPGKTLFTAATTTIVLAESDRILGGDEIVFDADGNPIVVTKAGLIGRTMESGGKALGHVSDRYIQPLYYAVLAFGVAFAALYVFTKLTHAQRGDPAMAGEKAGNVVDGKVADRD